MPPKRKAARGGGRPKRPTELSPMGRGSEEQVQKRQRVDGNGAAAAREDTEGVLSKIPDGALLGKGDEDDNGEDDRIGAMRYKNVGGSQVLSNSVAEQMHEEQQDMGVVKEGGQDDQKDDEDDSAEALPSTSTRGRGRGRRGRGTGLPRTRTSPRKVIQQSQDQSIPTGSNVRGRKPARGRGIVASNPLPTDVPAAQEVSAESTGGGEAQTEHDGEKEGEGEGEAEVPQHPQLSQPSSPLQQFQGNQQQQHSNQVAGADHTLHPSTGTFPSHSHPYYPSYPVQPPPFSYPYPPPPPPAADGRQYLAMRPDGTQPMYGASFATTVGTANGTSSASSSFNTSYPGSGSASQSLDANAPQGNPFPPSAPMSVPAYGTAVYSVGVSDDDDDDQDHEQGHVGGHINPGKKKAHPPVRAGGRAGRGDHVACHFCRGRKLKCDGRRPTCGHCSLRSLACKFDESVRRRGPGRKEKNTRRERSGAGNKKTGDVVVSGLSVGPQTPTPSHSQINTPSTEGVKRKRRPPTHMNHSHHGQTSILRFDEADGASVPAPGMKPASAAYGVDNNERLGYYYAGGPQYGPPYPQYGGFDHTGNPHHHPPQAGYGYAQDGEEEADGNAEVEGEGEGEGDDDQEVYGSRVEENAPYSQPQNEGYTNAWPAEPPGGVPVAHPHVQHM